MLIHIRLQIPLVRITLFFFSKNQQIDLWELLSEEYAAKPGEPVSSKIPKEFLEDKVVLLFLECILETLKNCDVNDCSDKGARLNFSIRKLLIEREKADEILRKEKKIANNSKPVCRHKHPKFDLNMLHMQKLNLFAHGIKNVSRFWEHILKITHTQWYQLIEAMSESYRAYSYLLKDLYPAGQFPFGWDYNFNIADDRLKNPLAIQHEYDVVYDLVQSHNEFIDTACRLEAECCPETGRFPRHILLGIPGKKKTAMKPDSKKNFDPLVVNYDMGATVRPLPYRHHFIYSMLFNRQNDVLRKVRSLHYRTWLLAYRYRNDDLMKKDIRITPSRSRGCALSDKAVPYYYAFEYGDDLHRNWSFDKTVKNRLSQVHSYKFINSENHPLGYRMDSYNFYRVEGILGKGLGSCMKELIRQKRDLGITFGIEPVFLPPAEINKEYQDQIASIIEEYWQSLMRLFLCKFKDLDVIFMVLLAGLIQFLLNCLSSLANTGAREMSVYIPQGEKAGGDGLRFDRKFVRIEKDLSEKLLKTVRAGKYNKGKAFKELAIKTETTSLMGNLYEGIIREPGKNSLYDQTCRVLSRMELKGGDAQDIANKIYPAVSLIDNAEELIISANVNSVAEFNFSLFNEKTVKFNDAFEQYYSREKDQTGAGEPAGQQQIALSAFAGMTGLVANTVNEVKKRIDNILKGFRLEGYSRSHPGMQHLCGVPEAGTLILLYTHKRFLKDLLLKCPGPKKEQTTGLKHTVSHVYGDNFLEKKIELVIPEGGYGAIAGSHDPLDDFVVIADFCIPNMCCDSDCSDLESTDSHVEK